MAFPPGSTTDTVGHGTYMAAIISADGLVPPDVTGLAPEALIWPIKVTGGTNSLLAAVNHVIDKRDTVQNLRVINLSTGSAPYLFPANCFCDSFHRVNEDFSLAFQIAQQEGIITLAASGNQGQCGLM